MKRTPLTLGLLVLLTFCLALPGYAASAKYWTTASCATIGGAGTWDTTSTQWSPNSTGGGCAAWANANSDYAYFSGTATYAVANAGNKTLNKIYHTIASEIIVSSSGILAFAGTGSGIDVVSGGYFSQACPFSGTMTKTGAGRMDANNSGTSGKWVISGGYISFAAVNRCGTATGSDFITFNGGGFGIGWASTGTSTTLSSAQGITINSGGAFFSGAASTDDLIIQSPILDGSGGTGTVGLNLTLSSPMVSPYAAGCVVILQNTTTTANAWAGPTTVSSSCTLQLGAANQIPDGSVVTMATGATFNLAGYNETIKSLSSSGGGAVQLGAGTLTLANPAGENAGSAVISGTGGKMVMTTGTWTTSSGSCTYDSGFTLNGGTLYIAGATALGTGTFTINGGTKIASSSTASRSPTIPVNLAADLAWGDTVNTGTLTFGTGAWTLQGGTRTMTLASAVTISSAIGDGGSGYGLTIAAGSSTLTLSGANSYSGGTVVSSGTVTLSGSNSSTGKTTINGGYVQIAADTSLGTAPVSKVADQLTLNSGTGGTSTTGLRFNAPSIILVANRGITLGANGGCINAPSGDTETINGVISGTLGGTNQIGANYQTGTGTNILGGLSTYNGPTLIAAGRLMLGVSGALPSGTALTIGKDTGGGAFFDLNGFDQTIGPLTSNNGIGGPGTGTPTIFLTSGGVLTVNETSSTTFGGVITGSGSLTLNGTSPQLLALSGANTYTGGTTINSGYLQVSADDNLGATSSTLTLNCGSSAGLRASGSFTLNSARGITLGANGGSINVASSSMLTYDGVINGTAGGSFWSGANYQTGTGTNFLGGLSTYNGATIIAAGRLMLGVNGALPSGTPLTIGADYTSGGGIPGAILDLNGFNQTIGPLASSTGIGGTGNDIPTIVLSGALTINETSSTAFTGQIIGSGGSLTLNGSATLTLSGANNTYSGGTTISAGTLALSGSGSVGTGPVTVGSGAAFDVSGLSTTLTLGNSQTLTGPSAAGTATINASGTAGLTLGTSTVLTLPYFAPGTPSFTITGGALTLAGGNTVHVVIKNGGTPLTANDYLLVSAGLGGSVAGTVPGTVVLNDAGSDGIAGGLLAFLQLNSPGPGLYLHVYNPCTPPSVGAVSPASQTVCAGSPATFTVSASGTAPLHYQWQKVGGGNVGTDSSSYTIASPATGDAGSYQCVVTGQCGSPVTATAGALTVHAPPTAANSFTTNAANHALIFYTAKLLAKATPGDSSSLSVSAAGPTSAQGPANNVALDTGAGTITYTPKANYTGIDSFTYTISDGNGCAVSPTITLTMGSGSGVSPNIVGSPTYDPVTGTFSVTFAGIPGVEYTVETSPLPSPSYSWSKFENVTAGSDGLFVVTDGPGAPDDGRVYRTVYPAY